MEWLHEEPYPCFRLDRDETIRANLLARDATFIDGFLEWRAELVLRDQLALTDWLFRFGTEYNDGSRWADVLGAAALGAGSEVATYIWSLRNDKWCGLGTKLFPWLPSLNAARQLDAFRLAAAFFAINECERYELCRAHGGCSHWWHAIS
ncbi:hypothetical protein RMSM_05165 [Rhodopirellula maiorica SM1]|uniref:Uncharacterized protein n=1 Tax=Rhodopirellula maiorica SM1 TaxID=1265738 RepID=M5REM2_9BACT|nr:hypothetical protein RMSM_05165 [Rhodopirellula maiorica SM1]